MRWTSTLWRKMSYLYKSEHNQISGKGLKRDSQQRFCSLITETHQSSIEFNSACIPWIEDLYEYKFIRWPFQSELKEANSTKHNFSSRNDVYSL